MVHFTAAVYTQGETVMTTYEAAQILRRMYTTAPRDDQVAQIHLFGIKYNRDLEGLNIKRIVAESGIPSSYGTEISKGRRLAKYVEVRAAYR